MNLKLVAQNYGSDPAAVAHDALLYAKSHKVDCVLIDSAGRMQTNKNLMEQITKIMHILKSEPAVAKTSKLDGSSLGKQAQGVEAVTSTSTPPVTPPPEMGGPTQTQVL